MLAIAATGTLLHLQSGTNGSLPIIWNESAQLHLSLPVRGSGTPFSLTIIGYRVSDFLSRISVFFFLKVEKKAKKELRKRKNQKNKNRRMTMKNYMPNLSDVSLPIHCLFFEPDLHCVCTSCMRSLLCFVRSFKIWLHHSRHISKYEINSSSFVFLAIPFVYIYKGSLCTY